MHDAWSVKNALLDRGVPLEIAQLGDVHPPELVRYIGPPCNLRTGITTPICTEGSHFCGVKVWLDFPNVPRRI
jgi:hypothetical protein